MPDLLGPDGVARAWADLAAGAPRAFAARGRLADYKVPEQIAFLRELPKGITGKVQRRALKETALPAVAGL